MAVIDEHRPLHVSIVGGEPLVRYKELSKILPQLAERGVHAQVVTSAVRQIPPEWIGLRKLQIVVSIDGLQPEHDERRKPATYDRILKHIEGHQITVHCTVTRQQVRREGYIEEFLSFWQGNPNVRLMWVSLYTPQVGEISMERLSKDDRGRVVAELRRLKPMFPKFQMLDGMLNVYANPPQSPDECVFAQDHRVPVVGPRAPHHAVPARRQPRLLELRLHRQRGPGSHRPPQAEGVLPVGKIFTASLRSATPSAGCARRRRRAAVCRGRLVRRT